MRRTEARRETPRFARPQLIARIASSVLAVLLAAAIAPEQSGAAEAAASAAGTSRAEAGAVERGFAEYKAALNDRDGARAAAAISANSFRYYDRMRLLALHAPRERLAELEGTERMLVLSLRRQAPREILEHGSPEDLVAYAVTSDAITDTRMARTEISEVEVQDDLARGVVVLDGKPTRGILQFVSEGGRWKFDLEFAMKVSSGLIAMMAERNGVSEDDVILELLALSSGGPIGPEIWDPPAPR